jgi:hypothetical protein
MQPDGHVRLPLGSLPQTEDINKRYMLRRGYYTLVQRLLSRQAFYDVCRLPWHRDDLFVASMSFFKQVIVNPDSDAQNGCSPKPGSNCQRLQ